MQVLEAKRELQGQLEELQMANEERSKELERARGVTPGPPAATTTIEAAKTVTPETNKTDAASSTTVDEFKANIEAEARKAVLFGLKFIVEVDNLRLCCSFCGPTNHQSQLLCAGLLDITITCRTKRVGRRKETVWWR